MHRAKWLDDATIELATTKCPALGLDRAEIIVALGHMLHGVLAKQNLWAFSKASIFTKLSDHRNVQHAAKIQLVVVGAGNADAGELLGRAGLTALHDTDCSVLVVDRQRLL